MNWQSGKFVECHREEREGRSYSADSANLMGIRTKPDSEETWQKGAGYSIFILVRILCSVQFHLWTSIRINRFCYNCGSAI